MLGAQVLRLIAAAAVVASVLGACSSGTAPPPTPSGSPAGSTRPRSTMPAVTTDAAQCPAAYPKPLSLQPESADEATAQATLVICTGSPTDDRPYGKGIFLRNVSDAAVWLIEAPESLLGLPVMAPRTLQVKTMQAFVQSVRPLRAVALPPRASFEESTVDPQTVRLSLDSSAQAAWQVLSLAVAGVAAEVHPNAANRIEMAAHRLLGATAPSKEAVLTCMAVAYDAGPAVANAGSGLHVQRLEEVLDLGNPTSACAAAIERAQQTSAVAGFTGEELMAAAERSPMWIEAEVLFQVAGRGVSPFVAGAAPG